MKKYAFNDLPQLQTLVFVKDGDTPGEPGRYGYSGLGVVVKLNDKYMLGLGDLLAENRESPIHGQVVSADDAKAEVIPVDIGVSEGRIHELVVRANLGHNLINLGRHR